jgi:hypothetical protein
VREAQALRPERPARAAFRSYPGCVPEGSPGRAGSKSFNRGYERPWWLRSFPRAATRSQVDGRSNPRGRVRGHFESRHRDDGSIAEVSANRARAVAPDWNPADESENDGPKAAGEHPRK